MEKRPLTAFSRLNNAVLIPSNVTLTLNNATLTLNAEKPYQDGGGGSNLAGTSRGGGSLSRGLEAYRGAMTSLGVRPEDLLASPVDPTG